MSEGSPKQFAKFQAGKVALVYLVFSIVWILASDQIASYFFSDGELTKIQTIKGIVFVIATSLVVFILVFRYEQRNKRLLSKLSDSLDDLENKVKERTKALNDSVKNEQELVEIEKRFIATASHEFRTPLTTILFTSGFIKRYFPRLSEKEVTTKLDTIDHQVAHMNSLLNDVLVLAKSDAGKTILKWERLKLNQLIATIVEEVTISTKKSHTIHYTPEQGCDELVSDEYLLRNILINLLTNSIKYSPLSKSVTMSFHRHTSSVELSVSDTGLGISPEDQGHLFEPFFRGKNISTIAGTGLGLSIVKRAVDQLKGTIAVHSFPDKGSQFIVSLPLQTVEVLERE